MKENRRKEQKHDEVSPMEMILAQQELVDLKREYGILEKETWRTRLGGWLTGRR